ncbi:MAG: NAD(+)/NADH kinase [Solirubrobacterales bacterium]|nr:NAD(+)/NADH kinase [Solirubrobacterales bacterium]
MTRYGLVVHPARDVSEPRERLEAWAQRNDVEVVALGERLEGHGELPLGEAEDCTLVVAIGGDGTILGGARLAAAAPSCPPVLGLAFGSLGILAGVGVADADSALDRFAAGDWSALPVDGLRVTDEEGATAVALNDVAVVRKGAGQVKASVHVDGELYVRTAGDGVVVSTALGSSAYGMAAGGPILTPGTRALCVTPLAMHGGSAPPLVVGAGAALRIEITRSFSGRRVELDGQTTEIAGHLLDLRLEPEHVQVVSFADAEGVLSGLRRRGIITDSPRVVAHDVRVAGE